MRARRPGWALLKEEAAHAFEAELAGDLADLVEILLEAVADEHQRGNPLLVRLAHHVLQHAADLGLAGETEHPGHQAHEVARVVDPAARAAFLEAAVVHELHVEAAERRGLEEHLPLHLAGAIPARLARGGRVHREHQTRPPAAWLGRRGLRHLTQKGLDRVATRSGRARQVLLAHNLNVGLAAPLSRPARLPQIRGSRARAPGAPSLSTSRGRLRGRTPRPS